MALTSSTLYEVVVSHVGTLGGKADQPIEEGKVYLGSKLPASSEPLVVVFGSTEAEKVAAKRAANAA